MKSIDKFFLNIFLLFQVNFFDFINIRNSFLNGFSSYSQKKILLIIVFIYCILKFLLTTSNDKLKVKRHFTFFCIFLLISTMILIFGTVYRFNQSFLSTFLVGYFFFIILLYFPFSREFFTWEIWKDVLKRFMIIGTFFSASKLIQSFMLFKFGKLIFFLNSNADYDTALQIRFNVLFFTRIPSISDFIFVELLLFIIYKIKNGIIFSRLLDNILLIINITCLICVGQSRAYIIIIAMVVLAQYVQIIFKNMSSSFKIFSMLSMLLILVFVVIILKEQIFSNESRALSSTIRQNAYKYYLNYFFYNKWFALGFARDDLYGNLIHGTFINNLGQIISANYDDVGIIGFLGRFGLLGVINIVIYLLSLMAVFLDSKEKQLTFLIFLFIFGSCISLSLFDPQRIFYLPLLLAFLDFLTKSNHNREEDDGFKD